MHTGEIRWINGVARVSVCVNDRRTRRTFTMPTCHDEPAARARAAVLAQLARRLRDAAVPELQIVELLGFVAKTPEPSLANALAVVEESATGKLPVAPPEPGTAGETLADYTKRWIADRERRGLARQRVDRGRLAKHVEPKLGTRQIGSITRADMAGLVEALDAAVNRGEVSWSTATKGWGLVTKLFSDACDSKVKALRVRTDNPAQGVPGPDRGATRSKQWIYPSEFSALLACAEVPLRWRELYALQAYLYLRPGELAALDWSAVQLEHGYVSVHQALDLETGETKTPKTKRGRKVPIPLSLRPLLQAMRDRAGGTGPVVRSDDKRRSAVHGLPPVDSLAETLRTHLERAGVTRRDLFDRTTTTKPVTFYDLRATGITWEALAGTDPLRIMQRAGHSTFSTTMGYIREADTVGLQAGEPFPTLPADMCGALEQPSSAACSAGSAERVEVPPGNLSDSPGILWRPQRDLKARKSARRPKLLRNPTRRARDRGPLRMLSAKPSANPAPLIR